MHIAEWEKLSYIRGKTNPPKESEDGYEKWYTKNKKVKRWLLMSMNPKIMKRYLRLPIAQETWSALSKAFYDGSDELQVVMKDPEDIAAYRKCIERQRVHIFLAGLDGDFEQVRGEILRKDPRFGRMLCIDSTRGRYPDWWDHNRDQQKKDFKKTSTVVVAEIKTDINVTEKASALVAATDYGGHANKTDD
ncbi:hypothetical protein CK203_059082 [Vitis vinifera]|uniref:Uncharacterized protein n=1 Tax=Vitis vinifera TaxID=29760 RepID=A0A438GTQ2_VITVI|nr:hypothetical protein CK203_059082 [Vitis vinifera]